MKHRVAHRNGFTLIEILIIIAVIAILAVISTVGYSGFQQRAAQAAMLSDLSRTSTFVESYALKNQGAFPDNDALLAHISTSEDVKISITLIQPEGHDVAPVYLNLSSVQQGVLFDKICNDLLSEYRPDAPDLHYGQGRDGGGNIQNFIWGPNFCNVYGPNQLSLTSSWGPRPVLTTPVSETVLPDFVATINHTDSYFPDRTTVEKQFYQTWHNRYVAAGGKYPITSFWNPSYGCNLWSCWNTPPLEPLPDPTYILPEGAHRAAAAEPRYCVLALHETYINLQFSFSSETLQPQRGNCQES